MLTACFIFALIVLFVCLFAERDSDAMNQLPFWSTILSVLVIVAFFVVKG